MNKKLITITACIHCIHYEDKGDQTFNGYCMNKLNSVDGYARDLTGAITYNTIPDWCKLPNSNESDTQ